jgi:hypothetical protein
MTPNAVRFAFIDQLLAEVAPSMPTRRSLRAGIAWRSDVAGTFHHVIVGAYEGDFKQPERYGLPIPRIHVNHVDFYPSRAAKDRWDNIGAAEHGWHPSRHLLELTVALDELVDFAPWVVAWTRAKDANDPALLAALPYPLEQPRTAEQLLATCYEWTPTATTDYERRRADGAADAHVAAAESKT